MSTARSSSDNGGASLSGACDRRGAGQLADQVDALLRTAHEQYIARDDHVVRPRVELPPHVRADRHHPHPGLRRERELPKGVSGGVRPVADTDPSGHLVRMPEVRPEGVRDPQAGGDHASDVGGRVAHLLDGVGDPQDTGHPLGILGASGREHRDRPEPPQVQGRSLFEPADLLGQLLLVEEDGRVGEVDHQLGGVLELDEEILDGVRLVIIHGGLQMMS